MTGPALSLRNVGKAFGNLEIIRGVSLDIAKGERHAIIGPNGAGKTTLFNLISGRFHISSGEILLNDIRIDALPPLTKTFDLWTADAALPAGWTIFRDRIVEAPADPQPRNWPAIPDPQAASLPALGLPTLAATLPARSRMRIWVASSFLLRIEAEWAAWRLPSALHTVVSALGLGSGGARCRRPDPAPVYNTRTSGSQRSPERSVPEYHW